VSVLSVPRGAVFYKMMVAQAPNRMLTHILETFPHYQTTNPLHAHRLSMFTCVHLRDAEEERAAVAGKIRDAPRVWAEAAARLDPAHSPGDIPPTRWLHFINDCGRFFDDGWASRAAALGWGPLDLFGCDRNKPFARIDRAGLLWLLNGRKLLAITAESASILTASGGKLTYHHCPDEPGRVLAWEIR
jgi:hypothetical protein